MFVPLSFRLPTLCAGLAHPTEQLDDLEDIHGQIYMESQSSLATERPTCPAQELMLASALAE